MKVDSAKLKIAIVNKGLNNKQVATAAGWSSVRRVEQVLAGKGINLNLNIAKAIAHRLGVRVGEISAEEMTR